MEEWLSRRCGWLLVVLIEQQREKEKARAYGTENYAEANSLTGGTLCSNGKSWVVINENNARWGRCD
jgi:hypothetical protein